MLGSADEAADLVQRRTCGPGAYRIFEGRSSLRVWLYRIVTSSGLTTIERRGRRGCRAAWAGLATTRTPGRRGLTVDDAGIARILVLGGGPDLFTKFGLPPTMRR
jgi:DNA-directed RNA polymerase specialized sigma24 family protein